MVCICDRDAVIAAAGGAKKEYLGKSISPGLEKLIEERENQQAEAGEKKFVGLVEEDAGQTCSETICPIIAGGDAIGAVILFSRDPKVRNGRYGAETGIDRGEFSGTADGELDNLCLK